MVKSRKPKSPTANQTGVGVATLLPPSPFLTHTTMTAFLTFFFTLTAIALCFILASL